MNEGRISFKAEGGVGWYTVLRHGAPIGLVHRSRDSYPWAPKGYIVWTAYVGPGHALSTPITWNGKDKVKYSTRREAVEAIVAQIEKEAA